MDEIIKEVVDVLQAAGGSLVYAKLHAGVSDRSKRRLYPALRQMKRKKQAALANPIDPETKRATFVVSLVSGGGD